jgi:hypothetical protein
MQADKLELIVNAQSPCALGINVPQSLLFAADEVIDTDVRFWPKADIS